MTDTIKPKTLRECLLVGGVNGRYFRSEVEPTIDGMAYGGYRVDNIKVTWKGRDSVDLSIKLIGVEDSSFGGGDMFLSNHLNDPELTSEEVNKLRNSFVERYSKWMSRQEEQDKPVFPLR